MMALFFGDGAYAVHKIQSLFEVWKTKFTGDVMLIDHLPIGKLMAESVELFALERRDTSFAGNTILAGKIGHELRVVEKAGY